MHNPIERKTEGVRTEVKKLRVMEGKEQRRRGKLNEEAEQGNEKKEITLVGKLPSIKITARERC